VQELTNLSQRITVGKIRETYLARENNADIDLCVDGDIVPLNTTMKDLGKFDDPYIAFRAVEKRVPRVSHSFTHSLKSTH
jgi:hypothetical protein